jgi:hypothetical protein
LSLARQRAQRSFQKHKEKFMQNSVSTQQLRLMNQRSRGMKTTCVDHFAHYEATSQAIQQLYSGEHPNVQPQRLQLQPQDPAIFRMIQENKARNTAKLKKLAELIKAKRSITLAEEKSRENTLALVKQFAAEARAKRELQEPTNTP